MTDLALRATARRDPGGGWAFVGSTGGNLTYQKAEEAPLIEGAALELAFDVVTGEGFEEFTIRTGELRLEPVALALEGKIEALKDPVRSVSLTLLGAGIPLSDLLAVLPDSVRGQIPVQAEGLVRADLRVNGEIGPGHLPTVTGDLALIDGEISQDGNRIAEGLTAALVLTPEESIRSRAQATVLGGPFSLEGTTTLGANGALDLVLRAAPELIRIGSLAELPDGVSAEGKLDVDLRITSPIGNFREARFRGNVVATGVHATHPVLGVPVDIPIGEIQISGIKAMVQDLPLNLGADRVLIS
jgi:hypothetical protein